MRYSVCWNTGKPMCKISCLMLLLAAVLAAATDPSSFPLWPGTPPGENGGLGPEKDTTKPTDSLIAGKPVVRLGPVSIPSMTLYRAPQDKNTGATVVVFPGGGYTILAMDLEGTEVCQWLNFLGVNWASPRDAARLWRTRSAPSAWCAIAPPFGAWIPNALESSASRPAAIWRQRSARISTGARTMPWTMPTSSVAGPTSRC